MKKIVNAIGWTILAMGTFAFGFYMVVATAMYA